MISLSFISISDSIDRQVMKCSTWILITRVPDEACHSVVIQLYFKVSFLYVLVFLAIIKKEPLTVHTMITLES